MIRINFIMKIKIKISDKKLNKIKILMFILLLIKVKKMGCYKLEKIEMEKSLKKLILIALKEESA